MKIMKIIVMMIKNKFNNNIISKNLNNNNKII